MKKKKLGTFGKTMFFGNSIVAVCLLVAYLLPYLPPVSFTFLSVLTLGMPILIGLNLLFLSYWILRMRKQLFLSLIVALIGFNHHVSLYKFENKNLDRSADGIKLMSYNVRQFNRYLWLKDKNIPQKIKGFIYEESPDVVCFQEYVTGEVEFEEYPHKYVKLVLENFGQAIYSKYPIVNSGSLNFKKTGNNVIYADIKIDSDTIRVFNMHLQSHSIEKDIRNLGPEAGKEMTKQVGRTFRTQEDQVRQLLKVLAESPYPNIITGDMNNTAFSYTYKKIAENHTDAFTVAGKGLGKTLVMDFVPLRIDFFFLEPDLEILDFTTHRTKLSDHEPISVKIKSPQNVELN